MCRGALVVQGEQTGEDFLIGKVGRPAVGGEDSFVEGAVGVGEPTRAVVIQVGQGAFAQFNWAGVDRI